jgi:hypothetical protein
MKRVSVYCGAETGKDPAYLEATERLGHALARRGLGLVYGGGGIGLMGTLADAVLSDGGEAIGVMPRWLVEKEIAHCGLAELHVVDSLHVRKAMMIELADGFIGLPGGLGTLEEFAEAWTWGKLGQHDKPCGLLNVRGFYDHLLAFVEHGVAEEFIWPPHRAMLLVADTPEELLDRFVAYQPPPAKRPPAASPS